MIIRQLSDLDQPHWYQRNDNLNHIHYIYELQLNPIDILTVFFGCFDREMCVFIFLCIVIAYLKTTHTHRLRFVFSDCNRLNFREQTRLSSMPSKWQMNRVRCSNLTFPLFDAAISWGSESRNRAARHTRSLYHHIGGGFLHIYESTTDTYIVVQINVRWTKQQPSHTQTHKHSNNTSPLTAIIPDERTTCVRFVRSSSSSVEDLRLRRASPQHIDTTYIYVQIINGMLYACTVDLIPSVDVTVYCFCIRSNEEPSTVLRGSGQGFVFLLFFYAVFLFVVYYR